MLDFPASPTIGQQFSSGTTTWQFDGVTWNIVPQIGPIFVGDTPPANPAIGQQWWRSTNGQIYVWYADPNSSQWVQSAGQAGTPGLWEPIFNAPVTSISQWVQTNLDAYESLRLRIDITNDTVNGGSYSLQLSEDNGATWIAGTSYANQDVIGTQTTAQAAFNSAQAAWLLAVSNGTGSISGGSGGILLHLDMHSFNKPRWTRYIEFGGWQQSSGPFVTGTQYGHCNRSIAANALKMICTQPSSGVITLEGRRG